MGTGASAQAGELVQGSSPEELQDFYGALSPEDRERLRGAVVKAGALAEEEASVEGDQAAPFLAEYFAKVTSHTAEMVTDQEKLLALAMCPEAQKKFDEDSKAWYEAEAKPLLEKSFKRHDINNSGVLDRNEAELFFKNVVREETAFAKAIAAVSVEAGIRMHMGLLSDLSEEKQEKVKGFLKEEMKKTIEKEQAEAQKKQDNYMANRAELDAAAFKVLDTSGDGTLQLVEFLAAFEPNSAKNVEMRLALGFVTKEEIEQQKRQEEHLKESEQSGECAQQ